MAGPVLVVLPAIPYPDYLMGSQPAAGVVAHSHAQFLLYRNEYKNNQPVLSAVQAGDQP